MQNWNLRHFRVFLSVVETGSLTQSAIQCNISQPAVSQLIEKLEAFAGGALFQRSPNGLFITEKGEILAFRLKRALERLDSALTEISPRLMVTASWPQLRALEAVAETKNFTLAARRIGLAQSTIHRSITRIEAEAKEALFQRTSTGILATKACSRLANTIRLATAEIDQAIADLAEFDGREVGVISVGTLPLARSYVLPQAIVMFRQKHPNRQLSVVDGLYDDLLHSVRRGELDCMIGALRFPSPIDDVVQEELFKDQLVVVAKPTHPLVNKASVSDEDLAAQQWVLPRDGAPARSQFDAHFEHIGQPKSLIECGSILLMREILMESEFLGCISLRQAQAEIDKGLLAPINTGIKWQGRPIGITHRKDWVPTKAQSHFLEMIRKAAAQANIKAT